MSDDDRVFLIPKGSLTLTQTPNDPIRPNHYKNCSNGAQVADICDRLDWNRGSAVKYIARAGEKVEKGESSTDAEIRDLNKAIWHVERRLSLVRGELEANSDPKDIVRRELLEATDVFERHLSGRGNEQVEFIAENLRATIAQLLG